MAGKRSTGTAEPDTVEAGEFQTFYDAEGREFRAYNAQDVANARFGFGYTEEKPKQAEEPPTEPAGDPGPTSGAVRE
jgi:hypothetical protein